MPIVVFTMDRSRCSCCADLAVHVGPIWAFSLGRNAHYTDDTWEWNGAAWTQRVIPGPSPRSSHGMVYDAIRDETVLFGGQGIGGGLDSNGETWVLTVTATYTFCGFFSRVDNPPVINTAKAGQSIPVKWHLTLNSAPVSDPSSFVSLTSYSVNCGTLIGNPLSAVEEYAAGSSGLQSLGNGNWQFNWKTPKTYANTCRIMVLTLSDGSTHTADFKFK